MQESLKPDAKPWFHNPWVWFLILIPTTSICLSFTMLWVAVTNKDPEVQDDWYKDKKAVRQDFARDEYASALSIQAQYVHTGKAVKFVINSNYDTQLTQSATCQQYCKNKRMVVTPVP